MRVTRNKKSNSEERKTMTPQQVNGVFGRMKQLRNRGPITIPVYVNKEGERSDRGTFYVQSLYRSKAGDPCAHGFVRRSDGTIDERTVRVDRIARADVLKRARFFCLKRTLNPARKRR